MSIEVYLTIAGAAYRRALEIRSEMRANASAFPKGPDNTQLAQEEAICAAIIANARALLSAQLLQLDFTVSGCALARPPEALAGGEYDQGAYDELFK
ncbi:hypothetical protein [Bradyrhizobium sp. CCGUVB23]|uniref:hypothetical protein n=1 Tax=Bradyrhizobium sp. CCGUVB23 TaxID=2949630 RepID=UPI0020B2AB12|nr:hypothetical protein [Bradyrhizobium sp. CCGUVB23]MCP3463082.1 hypothetical protein [Bradyrhizobium sp. CCGUVB23]